MIDVHDDTPMPKNSDPQSDFNRSILILTPQRALKFTAINQARHDVWLTALAFLSQSGMETDGLASIPPIPRHDLRRPPSQGSFAGFRRATIRDSIGMAKSKERPGLDGGRAHSHPLSIPRGPAHSGEVGGGGGGGGGDDDNDLNLGAAEPPYVPRLSSYTHTRKRSSTGPRAVAPTTSPSFSNGAAILPPFTLKANASHDGYHPGQHGIGQSILAGNGSMPTIRNNFFDAVGTVRMEAFVEPGERAKGSASPGHQRKEGKGQRTRQGRKKDLSYWGVGGPIMPPVNTVGGSEPPGKNDDPFKGF